MDSMILGPVLKSLIFNPPPLKVWLNLIKYGLFMLNKSTNVSHAPISMVVYVSKRCNFKCSFCFTYDDLNKLNWQEHELTLAKFIDLMDSDFGKKTLRVGFLGGEPLMNPDLFLFVKEAHKRGKITTIVTNASLVDEEVKKELKKNPPTMLGISLYDNNQDDVKNLSLWSSDNKINFWVQSVIESTNLTKIKDVLLFSKKYNISNLILSNYQPSYSHDYSKVIFDDNSSFNEMAPVVMKEAKSQGIKLTLPNPIQRTYKKRNCTMPFNYIHVDALGTMGPCCFRAPALEYGNIKNSDNWNLDSHKKIRHSFLEYTAEPLGACAHCENFSRDLYGL